MSKFIDFARLKEEIGIEQIVSMLNLDMKEKGDQFRGACPACEADRVLVVTKSKQLFYCFSAEKGGDMIALVAHVESCSNREAAERIAEHFRLDHGKTETKVSRETETEGFKPLDYLEHDHPAVEAVGFEPADAQQLGIGYASKGVLRGTVAIPVRLPDGTLAGYIGITEAKLPGKWHGIAENVVSLKKRA